MRRKSASSETLPPSCHCAIASPLEAEAMLLTSFAGGFGVVAPIRLPPRIVGRREGLCAPAVDYSCEYLIECKVPSTFAHIFND